MKDRATSLNNILQVLQVCVLAVGLAGVFVRLGESQANIEYNNHELVELKEIVHDLARSQIEFVSNDARLEERIDAIRLRLSRLESTN